MPVPMALFDDVESDDLEPSVLLVFEDVPLELVAFVWFLSRTILLLSSQHRLEAVPLDPELVPVPCAFAIPAAAMSAAPVIAARQILFMVFPLSLIGKNADKSQCGRSNRVPLNSLIALSEVATRGQKRSGARIKPLSRRTAIFGWGTKTNPLSREPLSADSICSLSNTGRTTTGRRHEENPFSDGYYSRIRCTFICDRRRRDCRRSSAAKRCDLVLPGSR